MERELECTSLPFIYLHTHKYARRFGTGRRGRVPHTCCLGIMHTIRPASGTLPLPKCAHAPANDHARSFVCCTGARFVWSAHPVQLAQCVALCRPVSTNFSNCCSFTDLCFLRMRAWRRVLLLLPPSLCRRLVGTCCLCVCVCDFMFCMHMGNKFTHC